MSKMPEPPWIKGIHEEYTCFSVDVQVCIAPGNRAYALHQLHGADMEIAATLPTHGEEQVAWALSQEALRREIWVNLLISKTQDDKYFEKYQNASADEQMEILRSLTNKSLDSLFRRLAKMGMDVSKELVESFTP